MRLNNVNVNYGYCCLNISGVHNRVQLHGQFYPWGVATTRITGTPAEVEESQEELENFVYRHKRALVRLLTAGLERDRSRFVGLPYSHGYIDRKIAEVNLICYI